MNALFISSPFTWLRLDDRHDIPIGRKRKTPRVYGAFDKLRLTRLVAPTGIESPTCGPGPSDWPLPPRKAWGFRLSIYGPLLATSGPSVALMLHGARQLRVTGPLRTTIRR